LQNITQYKKIEDRRVEELRESSFSLVLVKFKLNFYLEDE